MSHDADKSDGLSDFGKNVEAWRRAQGLSQRVLAEMIGTEQRTYSGWIKEGGLPQSVSSLLRLAGYVGMDLEELTYSKEARDELHEAKAVEEILQRVARPGVLQRLIARLPPSALGAPDPSGESGGSQ